LKLQGCLSFIAKLFLLGGGAAILTAASIPPKPVDEVIENYIKAVGGMAAVERIDSREVHANSHHSKLIYYWQKPNKVVLVDGKKRFGYDGGSGWMVSTKKRVSKMSKGQEEPLLMDANPLRYVHLKRLYSEVQAVPGEMVDNRQMDVLVAPNNLGSTKLFFDSGTHLLARVEESGQTSAYFKHVTEFTDYQEQDGLKLPFRIMHDSNEPGEGKEEVHISKVIQNMPLKPGIFNKPTTGATVLGGKR
jgi:hypothetical protein